MKSVIELIRDEGWEVKSEKGEGIVVAYGKDYPLVHPAAIHLNQYKTLKNPEIKYQHLKASHDYLWPQDAVTWHYWTERRFKAHCEGWKYISLAGSASSAKSYDIAKLALLFWLSAPKQHGVLVMSTTLESLNSRIYGYCKRLIMRAAVEFPYKIRSGQTAYIEYPGMRDDLHTIKAVAAKKGDDDTKIANLIGRHPEKGIMVIMDEATELPVGLLRAVPNLETCPFFQAWAIGNSDDKLDLHGSLSTPKEGWDSIDPMTTNKWETTQDRGVCLLFTCYDSPAIVEPDPVRKAALSAILPTQEKIDKAIKKYGKDSDDFWRMMLGFWKSDAGTSAVVSQTFLNEFNIRGRAEWSGFKPLRICAGLDPAFSSGGDQCILRIGIMGHDVNGNVLIDFREAKLLFKIKISNAALENGKPKSAELQIADQVLDILDAHNCKIDALAVDSNGQGRALSELIWLRGQSRNHRAWAESKPIKIYSVRQGNLTQKSFDVVIKTNYELWYELRRFIENNQIRGLDAITIKQLSTRTAIVKGGKHILETKADYKTKMGAIDPALARSPDEADACALCLQVAILKYGFTPGLKYSAKREDIYQFEQSYAYMMAKKEAIEAYTKPVGARDIVIGDGFTCDISESVDFGGMKSFVQEP